MAAIDDFITAMNIFKADDRLNDISPFHCEHDTLTVMANPDDFTEAELEELKALGFHEQSEYNTFYSFRFGSA